MKIELKNLHHVYPSGDHAIRGVSLVLEGTEPIAVIGQNGAGKTSMVKHLNGLLRPSQGRVMIDGTDTAAYTTARLSKDIGYVFQNPYDQLFLESVRKEFAFGPKRIGMSRADIEARTEYVAELVGLSDKLDVHPFDLTDAEKKFCTIGSVIMMNPKTLIFDEPTCGQDTRGITRLAAIMQSLRTDGRLCVTISHDMRFVAAYCKRIIVMSKGKVILDGPKEQVFGQVEQLKKSFVAPPPITRVAQGAGFRKTVFTTQALINIFEEEKEKQSCQM